MIERLKLALGALPQSPGLQAKAAEPPRTAFSRTIKAVPGRFGCFVGEARIKADGRRRRSVYDKPAHQTT
jgi:hypothetical protein